MKRLFPLRMMSKGRVLREGWTFHGRIIRIVQIIFDGFDIKKGFLFRPDCLFRGASRSDFSAVLSKAPEFRYEIPKESL